jgi:O-antigen/teichoic acid export membrane protein
MHRIVKNTSLLLLSQIGSRVLTMIYIAALARYIGPDGIGKISTAIALNGFMVLMLAPGLEQFLIREVAGDTDKATVYVNNMVASRLFLGIPFLVLAAIVSNVGPYSADMIPIICIYALVYLLDNLGEIFTSLFRAFQRMEYDAGTQVVRDLINFSLSLLAIYFRLSLLAIVLMSLVAQICKLLLQLALSYHRFIRPKSVISLGTMKSLIVSSLPFGGLVVLYTLQGQLGTLVLSFCHPPKTVGTFTAANTLVTTLMLMPATLSVAILPAFSRLYVHAPGDLAHYYALACKYLFILGFPVGLGTMLVGDQVIFLIYGRGFEGSTIVIRILAFFLFTFVSYCNSPLLYAAGQERFLTKSLALGVCGYGLLCILLIPSWGAIGAAIAFVTMSLVTTSVFFVACHRLLRLSLPWIMMGKVTVATSLMGLITSIALRSGMNWLVVTLLLAPTCYIFFIFLFGLVRREEIQSLAGLRTLA